MRRKPKSRPVDPHPVMPRGKTPFEEKRIACEFELVFKQIAEMGLSSLKETYEYAFRAGVVTGRITRELSQTKAR